MKKSRFKIVGSVVLFWLLMQSCFQFRASNKSQARLLAKAGINPEFGFKKGLDREIHYTKVGSDTTKGLVVFIHGSPGSSSNFLHFAKDSLLINEYDLLFLDRPGFGYSDFGESEPSLSKQSKILIDVIQQFDYANTILVGHSLGGPIICRMAMDDSTIAQGLLIVAGSISPELEPEEGWRKPMDRNVFKWMLPTAFRVSNQEIIPAKEELDSMTSMWGRIKMPVTILQGSKDKLVPAGNADYGEKMITNAVVHKYILEGKNHFIPFDMPERVTKEILEF